MAHIIKTTEGIFIPRELISNFEGAEVDASMPGLIVIRSRPRPRGLDEVLARIDRRRQEIAARRGLLDESAVLIRESREQELR